MGGGQCAACDGGFRLRGGEGGGGRSKTGIRGGQFGRSRRHADLRAGDQDVRLCGAHICGGLSVGGRDRCGCLLRLREGGGLRCCGGRLEDAQHSEQAQSEALQAHSCRCVDLCDLRALLDEDHHRPLAARQADENIVQIVEQVLRMVRSEFSGLAGGVEIGTAVVRR